MHEKVFRTKCMCGCGDGIELLNEKGHIKASFFRDDAGAKASVLKERAEYVAGKTLLREIMMDRDTFIGLLTFLEDADLEDVDRGGANRSHLAPTHLLDDIYAIWLQGTAPVKAVFGDGFRKMFRLTLTSMDRDVLVVQMKGWLAREKTHAIPEGASPHVDRLAGTSAPAKKMPTKGEVGDMASTAFKSVKAAAKAAAKAAMNAARHTADLEGAAMEDALEEEFSRAPGRGPFRKKPAAGEADGARARVVPEDDGIPDVPEDDEIPDVQEDDDRMVDVSEDDEVSDGSDDDEIPDVPDDGSVRMGAASFMEAVGSEDDEVPDDLEQDGDDDGRR